ncbi:hypothetical protein N9903_01430, partial [bacterium]|nr:hypothetical protein [bacterium]
ILPQLGGPGIAAHEVKKRSGFGVLYGPVRAEDLPRFLAAGLKADDGMRRVTFTTAERLVLVPMELVPALRGSVPLLIILWLLGGWGWWGYSMDAFRTNALNLTTAYLGALATGVFFTPLLLPWLPGRAFSVKGTLAGLIWALLFIFLISRSAPGSFPSRAWEGAVNFAAFGRYIEGACRDGLQENPEPSPELFSDEGRPDEEGAHCH